MSQVPKDLAEVEVFCWFAYWQLTRDILLWHWDTFFWYEIQIGYCMPTQEGLFLYSD